MCEFLDLPKQKIIQNIKWKVSVHIKRRDEASKMYVRCIYVDLRLMIQRSLSRGSDLQAFLGNKISRLADDE